MIASWLASKLFPPIAAGLAVLFLVGFIVQTVRIDGWPIFGGGMKQELSEANAARLFAENNALTLSNGLQTCNASVTSLKTETDKRLVEAQHRVDEAQAEAKTLRGNIARLRAIRSTNEQCPVADFILSEAFR